MKRKILKNLGCKWNKTYWRVLSLSWFVGLRYNSAISDVLQVNNQGEKNHEGVFGPLTQPTSLPTVRSSDVRRFNLPAIAKCLLKTNALTGALRAPLLFVATRQGVFGFPRSRGHLEQTPLIKRCSISTFRKRLNHACDVCWPLMKRDCCRNRRNSSWMSCSALSMR